MPRYFLKSSTVTQPKPIWDWLHNPDVKVLIGAETFNKAKDFVNFTRRQVMDNETLHYFFPECKVNKEWRDTHQWSGEGFEMPRKGIHTQPTVKPIGVGGAAQGIHVDNAYFDDLIGKAARDSLVVRLDTEAWFDNADELLVQPDMSLPNPSHLLLIGTHYGLGDLYCSIQERYPYYKWLVIPAEDDQGQPTWPEKMSAEKITEMKSDPKRCMIFYTQMQNNPMDSDLTDFDIKWLRYYRKLKDADGKTYYEIELKKRIADGETFRTDIEVVKYYLTDLEVSATIDPAVSESGTKRTSRTAITVVGRDKTRGINIVLEAWAKRLNRNKDLYNKVFEFHEKYRPRRWGIETFGQQKFIMRAIQEEASKRNLFMPIRELDKDVGINAQNIRIRSLQDDFVAGNMFTHESQRDFISEYLSFPIGTTNDIMDALSRHKQWWARKAKKEASKEAEQREREWIESRSSEASL